MFLAFGSQRPINPINSTAVVADKMHPRVDVEQATKEFDLLHQEIPTAVKFEKSLRSPSSVLGSLIDQLVVWGEIQPTRGGNLLEIQPMKIDRTPFGGSLSAWLSLPWRGPEHIILPGFQSDAGMGFRSKMNGDDLFLLSTALMGSGSRSLLISRWRTGGANSLALSRNFAQRQSKLPGGTALRESIAVARELDLNYPLEPLLKTTKNDKQLKADHPFFWSGFMRFEIPTVKNPNEPVDPAVPVEPAKNDAVEKVPADGDAKVEPPAMQPGDNPPADAGKDLPGEKPADNGDRDGDKKLEPKQPATSDKLPKAEEEVNPKNDGKKS